MEMDISYSKEKLLKENVKLMLEKHRLQEQLSALKEAYSMSEESFDEVCDLVFDYDVSGHELEDKLVELRAYDKQING